MYLPCDIEEYSEDLENSSPEPEDVATSSEADFIDTWSKIRDLSDSLCRSADETLKRGYVLDIAKLDDQGQDLARLIQKVTEGDDAHKRRLPPPLIRPRRRRKKCEEAPDKKRKASGTPDMYCHSCGTTDTVEWRRGPDGSKSLCNACGLHYAKMLKREMMIPNRQTQKSVMSLSNILAD